MIRIEPVVSWILTYAVHSTLLLGLAWFLTRRLVQSHGARDLIWKTALVGGLVTATVQVGAGFVPVAGKFSIARAADELPVQLAEPAASRRAPAQSDRDNGTRPAESERSVVPKAAPTPVQTPNALLAYAQRHTTGFLIGAWVLVAALLAAQFLIAQFLLVVRVGRRALVRDEQLLELVDLLSEEAGIRRHVRLTRAEGIPSPVALGMSEICIPDAALTELDREQQESMLAHELAHLARRDPAWLFVGCLIERLFFFQPLNRLARRRIQEAAEYLCDDWAVRRSGSGLMLAKCLVKVAEWIDTTPEPVPVSGMAEMRSHFVSRIHRLIANHALSPQPARRWLMPVALGALAVIVAAAPGVTATRSPAVDAALTSDRDALDAVEAENLASDAPAADAPTVSPLEQDIHRRTRTVTHQTDHTHTTTRSTATSTSTEMSSGSASSGELSPEERIELIAQGRDTSAVTALMAALKDEDPEVRRAAANALGNRRDPRAVPALIAALSDTDAEVRSHVVEALSNLKDPRATDGLIKALKDENPDVRSHAAEALGDLPDTRRGYSGDAQRVSEALASVITDVSAEVRKNAIQALREIRGVRMTDIMITALKDSDAEVRESAAEALGDMQARNAVSQLTTALSDQNADVRHAAAHALGNLKDQQTSAALAKALTDSDKDVRQAAAESLGELELAQAPQALLDAMKDQDPEVRHQAVEAIGNIHDPRAVPTLATMINDPDADVREAAIEALSDIRDAASIDALVKAMQSKDPVVRKRAAEALGERN